MPVSVDVSSGGRYCGYCAGQCQTQVKFLL